MEIQEIRGRRGVLSVSEVTRRVKGCLSEKFTDIWVRGEVSNYTVASSGHIYFTMKDETSVLRAVFFRGYQKDMRFELKDGMGVIVHGNLDVFEKRGEYQIIIDLVEPEGKGALQLAFEQLKDKLQKEGLFDESHKRQIPQYPDAIGVVTSPSGAAIRDILNVLGRRYTGVRVIVYPARVQGEGAADEIVNAIRKANERSETDVIIVGRGGGSIEDLWSFNEEIVARAIYDSQVPVISAVGHEIDFTIADFTADLRAPTPSAAAELVVKSKREVLRWSIDLVRRLQGALDRAVDRGRERASLYSPESFEKRMSVLCNERSMLLDDLSRSLSSNMENKLLGTRGRFERLLGQLDALSPLGTLSRGFALITKLPEKLRVVSIEDVAAGDEIAAKLKDGTVYGTVSRIEKSGRGRG
jgi:exodeoxyribonuclease VII large subunit